MDEAHFIAPGNRRKMQKRRAPKRELFGKERKLAFIEALSCSCNVAAAAEAAGVSVSTVYAHRLKDPIFRDDWWRALEQGAAKLVTLRLQLEIERAEGGSGDEPRPAMDGPPDPRQIADLYKLIGLLREHARGLGGEGRAGAAPKACEADEIVRALARRLKAFRARRSGLAGGGADGGPAEAGQSAA